MPNNEKNFYRISLVMGISIEDKSNFGNWEGDLMSFQKNAQHILVVRERTSMFTFSQVLESKKEDQTSNVLVGFFQTLPKNARKTIIFENGGEFARHKDLTYRLGIGIFFVALMPVAKKGALKIRTAACVVTFLENLM